MEKKKDIGAMWVKTSKSGDEFISLSVTIDGIDHRLVAFKNNYKQDGSNQPDYKIFKSNLLNPQKDNY